MHVFLGSGVEGQFVMAAVIGGTTSELTGGTFEAGAIYGGMQYSFNHLTTMQKTQLRVNATAAGVTGGTAVGVVGGTVCTAGAVVCSPAGALAGGAIGGVVGAAVAEIIIFINNAVDSVSTWFSESAKPSTLQPGPYAGESIPAENGPSRDFTPEERAEVDRIGRETGVSHLRNQPIRGLNLIILFLISNRQMLLIQTVILNVFILTVSPAYDGKGDK